jgi:hypothetical protein
MSFLIWEVITMDWRKILLVLATVLNWRVVLVISTALVLLGGILGISLWHKSSQQSSLPNGPYNVGIVKFSHLYTISDATLTGIELTDKETILIVEYLQKYQDEIPPLKSANLIEVDRLDSNWKLPEYVFLRSEPLTFREPLISKAGQRVVLKFYFERLKGGEPKTLKFEFRLDGTGRSYAASFPVKKI